jgi:hypothetical protein
LAGFDRFLAGPGVMGEERAARIVDWRPGEFPRFFAGRFAARQRGFRVSIFVGAGGAKGGSCFDIRRRGRLNPLFEWVQILSYLKIFIDWPISGFLQLYPNYTGR